MAPHRDGIPLWVLAGSCLQWGWLWVCSCSLLAFPASPCVCSPHPGPQNHPQELCACRTGWLCAHSSDCEQGGQQGSRGQERNSIRAVRGLWCCPGTANTCSASEHRVLLGVTARQKWDFSWIHGQGPPGCSVAPASAKLAAHEHLTGSRCCHSHTGTSFHLPKCNLIFLAGKFWLADVQLPTCLCCCSSRLGLTPTGSRGTGTCPRSCSSPGVPRRSWHRRVSASLCCTEGHDAHSPPCLPRVTASPRLGTG